MEELIETLEDIQTEKNTKLLPGNIKKDVTVLGVTGTYEGSGVDGAYVVDSVAEMNALTGMEPGDYCIVNGTVPSIYDQLESIDSSSTQFIDTGLYPNQTDRIVTRASLLNGGDVFILGSRTETSPKPVLALGQDFSYSQNFSYRYGYTAWTRTDVAYDYEDILNIDFTYRSSYQSIVVNETNTTSTNYTDDMSGLNSVNIYLFGMHFTGKGLTNDFSGSAVRIYNCKIYNGNALLRYFVPVRRKSDSVIGMYDLITETFFTNQGTGVFTFQQLSTDTSSVSTLYIYDETNGWINVESAVPEDPEYDTNLALSESILGGDALYTPLQYIQSSGTQYLNLNFDPIDNYNTFVFQVDMQAISFSSGTYSIFGTGNYFMGWKNDVAKVTFAPNSQANVLEINRDTNRHTFTINALIGKYSYDAQSFDFTPASAGSSTTHKPMLLFGWSSGTYESLTVNDLFSVKLYEVTLCNGYELDGTTPHVVCHLIPVKRNSDEEVCMYDTVSATFFTNQGTGVFTAGPVKTN